MRWFLVAIAVGVTACAGGHHAVVGRTRLGVTVERSPSPTRYTLTCGPAGGTAPSPVAACRALEDFLPRTFHRHPVCWCPLYSHRIMVRGVLDGRMLHRAVEISGCAACGLGPRARSDVIHAFAAFHLSPG